MASTSIKRSRDKDDSDEDWCSNLSSFKTPGKRIKKMLTIPSETSKWTEHDLQRINISYSNSIISSPDELIDQFECIKVKVPALDEDFIRIYEYVQRKFNFDFSGDCDDLRCMLSDTQALHFVLEQLHALFKDLTTENEENQTLKGNLKEESQFLVDIIRVAGSRFVSDLINFLVDYDYAEMVQETVYTSLLQKFCEMCNFNGSIAVHKQKGEICNVQVASVPDLVFIKPWIAKKMYPNRDCIISVAEVKETDITGPVMIEKRQTRSSESDLELITVPQHPRGLPQHVGQLLLANRQSFVLDHSLGIVLNNTKVIFTCLVLTKTYLFNMKRRLNDNDKGVVYTCGPYDLFKASDRQILLKTFIRLGLAQQKLDDKSQL